MSAPRHHTVSEAARPTRVDKALSAAFPEHSRSEFQRAIDAGLVTRAGAALERSSLVRAGDTLAFSFPDTAPAALRPVAIHLDILYEDAWLVAVNKPAGMVVHPGAATGEDTLVHALLAHCGASLSGIGGVERPGIVHRLDRETSGVVIAAKNDRAHRALAAQFAERTARKEYRALVAGIPRLMSGSVRKAIGRNPRHRHKMAALEDGGGGRPAWTDWELVERFGERAALLSLALHTGRTHQIRVHMASMGHPILGDVTYGWKPDGRGEQPGRTLLHAARLRVAHPVGGRILDLKAPLPPDFLRQLRLLRRPA